MAVESPEWRDCRLGDVVELKRGYDLPQQQRTPGRVPVVSSSGRSGFHSEAMVKAPGVVTRRYGTLGQVFYVAEDFWPLNTTLYVRDFKGNDPKFVSYFLKTIDFYSCSDKAAVPGVNRNHLHELRVRVPVLADQRRIAHVLGALDDKIELNRKMNETLEAMARALFKSWFVDFDPVRAKAEGRTPTGMDAATAALFPSEFTDSELGPIPRGWHVGNIGDVATNRRDTVHPSDVAVDFAYVGLEHMPRGRIFLEQTGVPDELESLKARFTSGDVLFGKLRPYFRKVALAPDAGICSTDILVLAPRTDAGAFVLLATASGPFLEHAVALSDGTKMPRTSWEQITRFRMCLPSSEVLAAFQQFCMPLFARADAARLESASLARTRDELLPRLLSGELEVGRSSN